MAKSKYVSLATIVEKMSNSKEGKEFIANLKERQKQSPAKYALQYNPETMNICMEMVGRINIIASLQDLLTPAEGYNANELTSDEAEQIFSRRTDEIYALYEAQVKYDRLKSKLKDAVIAEETKKQ